MPQPVILDCDPGIDDTVAIMLALGSREELDVIGITAVHGNVPVAQTTVNALKIAELCGRSDVPVARGCPRPLLRPELCAHFVHGNSGLGNVELPAPATAPIAKHAVDFIVDSVGQSRLPVTLVATGTLTNVALAIVKSPEIMSKLARIVIMGGGMLQRGNMPNGTGFNIYADPHAAEIVFKSGIPIVQITRDLTHMVQNTMAHIERFRAIGTRAASVVADLFQPHVEASLKREPDSPVGGCMHDPCTVAYLLQPDLFRGREANVQIDSVSEISIGSTVIDWWHVSGREPNALVLNHIDQSGFFDLLCERLARLP